jgi:hypothetical protein
MRKKHLETIKGEKSKLITIIKEKKIYVVLE